MAGATTPSAARAVAPAPGPLAATVTVPGSKSLTNRALVCAALARGTSVVRGALVADDTEAMRTALARLGAGVEADDATGEVVVTGTAGRLRPGPVALDLRLSGTTSRFRCRSRSAGVASGSTGGRRCRPARARPTASGRSGRGRAPRRARPPAGHRRAPGGLEGRGRRGRGVSSQFSGLLLRRLRPPGLRVRVTTPLVSRPYVGSPRGHGGLRGWWPSGPTAPGPGRFEVAPGGYRAATYDVEPDASTASYFLAAAAIAGGRVTVEGLGEGSRQGDARFADLLAAMGARVERTATSTTVVGTGRLRGLGEVDMRDMPDMAQTLAAVAVFAEGATRVTGIEVVRGHETDRIATPGSCAGVIRRGATRTVHCPPGTPRRPASDLRRPPMAMSFALGLRAPGIEIADPGCVRPSRGSGRRSRRCGTRGRERRRSRVRSS